MASSSAWRVAWRSERMMIKEEEEEEERSAWEEREKTRGREGR